ncbi:hypothetical protein Tco_1330093 [Tanacetum coccineum]
MMSSQSSFLEKGERVRVEGFEMKLTDLGLLQQDSLLTLKPSSKNLSKRQRKEKIEEDDELKELKHSELKTKKFEEIQALYEKIKRSDEDFISIGSAEDERLIKRMNEKGIDSSKSKVDQRRKFDGYVKSDDEEKFWNSTMQECKIVSWKLHGSSGVHTLVTESGLVIHMLVEKKYPLRKKVLCKSLELNWSLKKTILCALD